MTGVGVNWDCLCLPFLVFADSGISLENGVYAAAVVPGSPAAKEGSLAVGDRIVAVSLGPGLSAPRGQLDDIWEVEQQSNQQNFHVRLVL